MFKVLYKKILNAEYKDRSINRINWNLLRSDEVYEKLTKKYFYDKNAYNKIMLILEKLSLKTSTELAFLAYIYALNHKRDLAIETMEKVIYIEKWENIDSFIDFWHFLRKIDDYQELSVNLLLNLELYMWIYIEQYNKWKPISLISILNDK